MRVILTKKGGSMRELSPTQLKAIDELLNDYKRIDKAIAVRRLELEGTANNDRDINKFYSKGLHVSKPTETIAIKLADDYIIQSLTAFKNSIDMTLKELDREQIEIFYKRWTNGLTWEEIADVMHIKTKNIYRKRKVLINRLAYNLGLNYY